MKKSEFEDSNTEMIELLLNDCETDLQIYQQQLNEINPNYLTNSQPQPQSFASEIEVIQTESVVAVKNEKEEVKSTSPVPVEIRNEIRSGEIPSPSPQRDSGRDSELRAAQSKKKAELREKISELDNKILELVDLDEFDEAEKLEQERIELQNLLNSLQLDS